jgi:hypothetical protein
MHVRVCVECGEEYRPEIAVCADCGGALEDRHDDAALPEAPASAPGAHVDPDAEGFTDSVLAADAVSGLTAAADRLAADGIGFRIRPAGRRGRDGELAAGYRLLVAPEDREDALGALGLLAPERSGEDARQCPACEAAIPAGAIECPECGLAAGDDPNQATCATCGRWLDGPGCPECGT